MKTVWIWRSATGADRREETESTACPRGACSCPNHVNRFDEQAFLARLAAYMKETRR